MDGWIRGVNNEVSYKRMIYCISKTNFQQLVFTNICKVESILNQKLSQPNNDSSTDFLHVSNDLWVQWKDIQASANVLWNCWLNHYLPTLTSHQSCTKRGKTLSINDLLTKTKNIFCSHWHLKNFCVFIQATMGWHTWLN